MPEKVTPERQHAATVQVVHLLEQATGIMTGWVLRLDRDEVADAFEPVHVLLDRFIPEAKP